MKTAASTTLQDGTYNTLRQWLSVGKFLPGERLKIQQLAATLSVGAMPVRAALQRLAAEGALVNVPNCGVTVPQLSKLEFEDVLQNRLMLEGEAAERGAARLNPSERAGLIRLGRAMEGGLDSGDLKSHRD